MENRIIKITGCINCPLLGNDGNRYCCNLAKSKEIKEDGNFDPITPIFCPVKKNNIIVKY